MGTRIGINGLGRIGKLAMWNHVANKDFSEIVVNVGRAVGTSLKDIAYYIERDSTYGSLKRYLYGFADRPVITEINDQTGTMLIDGVKVTVLRKARNPRDIAWADNGVDLVVDATGSFVDPTRPGDDPKGALAGHFDAGARKVIVSAPFKIKDKVSPMPADAVTVVMGVNEHDYDSSRHRLISGASCTTTCLAHMFRPLINAIGPKNILTASMATVHAATGSQEVLDRLAKAGDKDLRKNRSIFNNIILTTTGAADTLALVIPELAQIGFIAESVRIPTTTGSLVILVVNIQEEGSRITISREYINGIYKEAAALPHGYVVYSEEQNVSCDIISTPRAAVVIEGHETHTRTAEVTIDVTKLIGIDRAIVDGLKNTVIGIPLTQAVIYGWYDNEMGSYVSMLGKLTRLVAEG
ncbi:type I glyceraldehyde-3-phosphate dehydrogenase [Candidatus Magnetobacterium casense]|uniref:Glyceraldehyde-3-phosphate dehydrogenase n=1 Tax=Candidatus Magnetobacterium casense TaxID=1455061 RepID=A0ABS6RV41_9BACT|nr:glyceraldehyde 3-phosphate dehydrogenase NAD-binding domain-containing protein [Candidatus Magnetobacterium casensis]MBV6340499.1 glyceraldehyde-3-phosphate dehydrogenase [Candidatus Magnetobacterium casensis]